MLHTGGVNTVHPLLAVQLAAAQGTFPAVDGEVEFLPALPRGIRAVLSFTGHAFVATDQDQSVFSDLSLDGFGGALQPEVLVRLGQGGYRFGHLDLILVGRGLGAGDDSAVAGGSGLPLRADLDDHPRVQFARAQRERVRVFADDRGLVTLADGVAGRPELSIEVDPGRIGGGTGRALLRDALALVPAGAPIFAAVTPGNARSLRMFLASDFRPIGSQILALPPQR